MSKQENKVFVGGLSWETTDQKLRAYFENYGSVLEAFVSYDRNTGRPRGFGFVVFESSEIADKVVATKHTIDRREVEAKKAVPKEDNPTPAASADTSAAKTRKIFVGGLAPSVNEDALRQYFEQFGQVEDAVVMYDHDNKRPRGFGFITFAEEESVDKVFAHGAMQNIHDKPIEIKPAVPRDQMPPVRRAGQGALIPGRGGSPAAYSTRGATFPFRQQAGFPAQAAYGQRPFPSIGGQRQVAGGVMPGYRGSSPQGTAVTPTAGAAAGFPGGMGGVQQMPGGAGRFPGGANVAGRFPGINQQQAAAAYGMYGLGNVAGFQGNVPGGPDMGAYNFANLQQQFQQQQQQQQQINGFQGQLADMAGKLGQATAALGGGFAGFPAAAQQQYSGTPEAAGTAAAAGFAADPAAAAAAAAAFADAAGVGGALPGTSPLGTPPDFANTFGADGSRFPGGPGTWGS